MIGNAAIDFRAALQASVAGPAPDDPAFLSIFADDYRIYLSGNETVGRQLEHTILKARGGRIYHLECATAANPALGFQLDLGRDIAGSFPQEPLAGFFAGTMIETPDGPRPVERLNVGDLVLCGDGEARAILWRTSRKTVHEEAGQDPGWRPILIRRDALASGLPRRDLLVTPNQRVLIDDWRAELMFGETGVLVSARALVDDDRTEHAVGRNGASYHSLLLEDHQIIRAEGLAVDSLFLDPDNMAAIGPEERRSLAAAVPGFTASGANRATRHPVLSASETLVLLGG